MRRRAVWVLAATVLAASLALAWNPLVKRPAGALRWNTASAVAWNPDGGVLGKWSNATAITEVTSAFTTWQNVGFSVISYSQGGQIEDGAMSTVDVTSANYAAIIALNNGQNPIIFDNDRDIFDLLGTPDGVLGFAGTLISDGSGTILKGYAVLQGDWFDNDTGDVGEVTGNEFRAMFVHEFGHFSGLGHSLINRGLAGIGACPAPTSANYVTMNPFNHADGRTLHFDDVRGLSVLYPTASFSSRAKINGTLFDIDGTTPFDGANMVLRPDTANCTALYDKALSMQSGVNPGETGGAGTYQFDGIAVPDAFTLYTHTIADGGSYPIGGTSPPVLTGPAEFHNGASESNFNPPDDPAVATSIPVVTAGSTVAGIDILLNALASPGEINDNSLEVFLFDGNTPGEPQTLVADDDDLDTIYGLGGTGQLAWVNRFTPASLPFRVEGLEVFFFNDPSISVGRPIQLLVLTDSGGTGNPDNATLAHTENTTINSLNAFNPYTFSSPVTVDSGDFYVGVYDLDADTDANFIASADIDTTGANTAFMSFTGPTPPSNFGTMADFGVSDRTWMIRANGSPFPTAGTIRLSWGESCNEATLPGQDYAVYQGTIASLSGTQDHAPTCGTGGQTTTMLPPTPGNLFWVVAPFLGGQEGSQGSGTTVPRAPVSTCQTVNPAVCPP